MITFFSSVFAVAVADQIVCQLKRGLKRPLRADHFETGLFHRLLWELAYHGGDHHLAVFQCFDDTVELGMAKGVIGIERAVFFDLDFCDLNRITLAILEDAKFFGMAEVLIDLCAGF